MAGERMQEIDVTPEEQANLSQDELIRTAVEGLLICHDHTEATHAC